MTNKNAYVEMGVIIIIFVIIALLIGLLSVGVPYFTQQEINFTVSDKTALQQTTTDCDKDGCTTLTYTQYLIYTEGDTLENINCLPIWKWNSAELYGKLKINHTYHAKVYGWRVPILGWYQNIISFNEVTI